MDGNNAYIYAGGLAPTEQVSLSAGAITYLITDSLGSVRGTVNSSGTLSGTTAYDAWGNPETAGGLTSVSPFGYSGGYTDPDGLIYLINRYYNSNVGQLISVDPLIAHTQQAYTYASGNPVDDVDPTGELGIHLLFGGDHLYGLEWTGITQKELVVFLWVCAASCTAWVT
jgi:RHS repeat-associated protein